MVLSGWEAVFFWVFALAALIAGLLTVMARNAVHSAMFLISTLVSVAALFILLGAEFIAGVQILVYGLFYAINKSAGQSVPAEPSADEMPAAQAEARREAALRPAATGVAKL